MSYYPEHKGHSCDIAHIRLRRPQREAIAVKLAAGIPFDDVLDSVHSTASVSGLTNLQFLSKQDLLNITREFGINKGQVMHQNDADSVAAWIHRTQQEPSSKNLVRLIKFQGETSPLNLQPEDFMLVLASDAQIIGARQFCRPNHEVCLDSTHGMNSYDFQLTTLMAIDEHGEGYPVAFCYSNHVDECAMRIFLQVVKDAIGYPIHNVILMTDDTEVYSNAWSAVMGEPAHRLLCTWHVDRAWRKNLSRIKGDSELKAIIYKTVRSLMEIRDPETFIVKMKQFLEAGKEDARTSDFVQYFDREYSVRPQLWAYCHRLGLKVHHNMHLEAMHRVIKHVHLQGRKVRRLDKSIHALMKFMRTKMSDRLLKLHKGKWTRHVGGIRQRHQSSLKLNAAQCSCVDTDVLYTVLGSSDVTYTVRRNDAVPHESRTCPLMCAECNACVHAFSCTCLDSALRNTICKHIHLVVQTYQPLCQSANLREGDKPNSMTQVPMASQFQSVQCDNESYIQDVANLEEVLANIPSVLSNISESDAIISDLSSHRPARDTQQALNDLDLAWSNIRSAIQDKAAVVDVVLQHVNRLSSLVTVLCNQPETPRLPPAPPSREPVNKLATTQRYFKSTRRHKPKKRQLTASKPNMQEKEFLLRSLSGNEPVVSQQPILEHDYASNSTAHVINFEHSYA